MTRMLSSMSFNRVYWFDSFGSTIDFLFELLVPFWLSEASGCFLAYAIPIGFLARLVAFLTRLRLKDEPS